MGIIELQNISKSYKTKDLYSSINEVFDEKDSVAFVGHNGCGKSTLNLWEKLKGCQTNILRIL